MAYMNKEKLNLTRNQQLSGFDENYFRYREALPILKDIGMVLNMYFNTSP